MTRDVACATPGAGDRQNGSGPATSPPRLALRLLRRALMTAAPQTGLAWVCSRPAVRRLCRDGPHAVATTLVGGREITVDLRDFNGRMLYLFGTSDPKVVRTCASMLAEGDVFLDIGANHGEVGILCGDAVGARGEVHLFEPLPALCDAIRRDLSRAKQQNVAVHEYGLGPRDETVEFLVREGHTGTSRAAPAGTGRAGGALVSIRLRDVCKVVSEVVGTRPAGAKVDVEGSEDAVVPPLLTVPSMKFVVFEWEHIRDKSAFAATVRSRGFDLFGLEKRIWRPRLLRVGGGADEDYADVVAIRRELCAGALHGLRIGDPVRAAIRT